MEFHWNSSVRLITEYVSLNVLTQCTGNRLYACVKVPGVVVLSVQPEKLLATGKISNFKLITSVEVHRSLLKSQVIDEVYRNTVQEDTTK